MGMSPPVKGKIESSSDVISYTPLESWSGTERFGYSISDGRGVATASVIVIVQSTRVENQLPEAQDQDISINGNSPVKIKLEAQDPDDGKLRFAKPSHGRIVQFSSSTGTLAYVPDENYDGKEDFAFKVHDGTAFSKDAKVSIKTENIEKLSNDQVQASDQQQNKDK
jgi:large repetitive protein